MKKDQLTCNQRITVILHFYPTSRQSYSIHHVSKWKQQNFSDSNAIKEWAAYLSHRIEDVVQIIEILQSTHEQWIVTGKKDRVILETDSFDVQQVVAVLAKQGFHAKDYQLYVEYERKWGIL